MPCIYNVFLADYGMGVRMVGELSLKHRQVKKQKFESMKSYIYNVLPTSKLPIKYILNGPIIEIAVMLSRHNYRH